MIVIFELNLNISLRSDTVLDNYAVSFYTEKVSLVAAILNNYPQYFYHPLLADTEHIPIASNLENAPHGV